MELTVASKMTVKNLIKKMNSRRLRKLKIMAVMMRIKMRKLTLKMMSYKGFAFVQEDILCSIQDKPEIPKK